jgi:hypothetical protein
MAHLFAKAHEVLHWPSIGRSRTAA